MFDLLKTQFGRFRAIAFLEGTSLLTILFITMPLKYMMAYPMPNKVMGMLHGLLFLLYVLAVIQMKFAQNWNFKKTFLALIASVIPFGTFWADKKLFNE